MTKSIQNKVVTFTNKSSFDIKWKYNLIAGFSSIISSILIVILFDNYVEDLGNIIVYNLIALMSGIIYYMITIFYLRFSFKRSYFIPENIPNYIISTSFVVTGSSMLYPINSQIFFFLGISGLFFTGISFLILTHYEKQRKDETLIQKDPQDNSFIVKIDINYPILGLADLLNVNLTKTYDSSDSLQLLLIRLESTSLRWPLIINKEFSIIGDINKLETPSNNNNQKYMLYVVTEDINTIKSVKKPFAYVLQSNMTRILLLNALQRLNSQLEITYELVNFHRSIISEIDFFKIQFKMNESIKYDD